MQVPVAQEPCALRWGVESHILLFTGINYRKVLN